MLEPADQAPFPHHPCCGLPSRQPNSLCSVPHLQLEVATPAPAPKVMGLREAMQAALGPAHSSCPINVTLMFVWSSRVLPVTPWGEMTRCMVAVGVS
jgi:hypothetical protein